MYNTCLSEPENQPDGWFSFDLRTEQVWDGFCLLTLLEDHALRHAVLTLPHDGQQKDRFTDAMAARNLRIQQAGQEEYGHVCKKCVRVWMDDDGTPNRKSSSSGESIFTDEFTEKCSVLVIDGITIGHPCCGILHCTVPLANNRHRYCLEHDGHHHICAVDGCFQPVAASLMAEDPPRMTCDILEHATLEKKHKQRGTAFFQLRGKLQRANVSNPVDSEAAELTAEEVEEMELTDEKDEQSSCPSKPDTGIRKIRALFGRRRTHNEQIMVRPCGMIVARQTFFGSETTPQTVVSGPFFHSCCAGIDFYC